MSWTRRFVPTLLALLFLVLTGPLVLFLFPVELDAAARLEQLTVAAVFLEFYLLWLVYLLVRPKPGFYERFLLPIGAWLIWLFVGYATFDLATRISPVTIFESAGLLGLIFFMYLPWFGLQYLVLILFWVFVANRLDGTVQPGSSPPFP